MKAAGRRLWVNGCGSMAAGRRLRVDGCGSKAAGRWRMTTTMFIVFVLRCSQTYISRIILDCCALYKCFFYKSYVCCFSSSSFFYFLDQCRAFRTCDDLVRASLERRKSCNHRECVALVSNRCLSGYARWLTGVCPRVCVMMIETDTRALPFRYDRPGFEFCTKV